MAKVTNAITTYLQKGNREDFENAIYNIDPFDTPFMTLAGRRNVDAVVFDWQTEKLPNVNATNAQQEGFVLVPGGGTFTTRLNNTVQISERDATVSGTAQKANAAGKPKGEMARQMALAAKALKRDMETIACSNQPRVDGADNGAARQTEGFEHSLKTNVSAGAGYAAPASQTATGTDGTIRTWTEGSLNDVMELCYANGAEPTELFLGPYSKRRFSTFTGRSTSQVLVGKAEAVATVDIYASDFGKIKGRPSRWIRNRTALLIDPRFVKVAYFRGFQTYDMAKTGDAEVKMILAEWGIQNSNEAAHAKIADIPGTKGVDPSPLP